MEEFLKSVKSGNRINPSEQCLAELKKRFEGAINVEWSENHEGYEAIFYKENIEYIAYFSQTGKLKNYKMHLPEAYLPEAIKTDLEKRGEIMNSVKINKGDRIEFEIILRDSNLVRYLILLTDLGKEISCRKL